MPLYLDSEVVSSDLLWSDIESKSAVPVVVQLGQGLLPLRTLALDGQLVLAGGPEEGVR